MCWAAALITLQYVLLHWHKFFADCCCVCFAYILCFFAMASVQLPRLYKILTGFDEKLHIVAQLTLAWAFVGAKLASQGRQCSGRRSW